MQAVFPPKQKTVVITLFPQVGPVLTHLWDTAQTEPEATLNHETIMAATLVQEAKQMYWLLPRLTE